MADNVTTNPGSGGAILRTHEVASAHFQRIIVSDRGPVNLAFSRLLDTVGDGSGTKPIVGDYSGAVTQFMLVPDTDTILRVTGLRVVIRDATIDADDYGGLGSPLTNGIEVQVRNGAGIIIDLTDEVPVKANADWGRYAAIERRQFASGDEILTVDWRLEHPLRLDATGSEYLTFRVHDNLTGLVDHYCLATGVVETTET